MELETDHQKKLRQYIDEFYELIQEMSLTRHYRACIILKGQYQHVIFSKLEYLPILAEYM